MPQNEHGRRRTMEIDLDAFRKRMAESKQEVGVNIGMEVDYSINVVNRAGSVPAILTNFVLYTNGDKDYTMGIELTVGKSEKGVSVDMPMNEAVHKCKSEGRNVIFLMNAKRSKASGGNVESGWRFSYFLTMEDGSETKAVLEKNITDESGKESVLIIGVPVEELIENNPFKIQSVS